MHRTIMYKYYYMCVWWGGGVTPFVPMCFSEGRGALSACNNFLLYIIPQLAQVLRLLQYGKKSLILHSPLRSASCREFLNSSLITSTWHAILDWMTPPLLEFLRIIELLRNRSIKCCIHGPNVKVMMLL